MFHYYVDYRKSFRELTLISSVQKEIVRVLASKMFCHNPNPNNEISSKMLMKKYNFMRDIGDNVSENVSILIY